MPHDVPVLISGAGPAGLAAALELARHDIPLLLVERRPELSSHPRATVLSLRSMELVRSWGLEEAVRERSVEVGMTMRLCRTLAAAADGEAVEVGYPSPEQSRLLSPTTPACVAQDEVEPLLLERLRSRLNVTVALGTEVTGIFAGPGGARLQLLDLRSGDRRTVHARHVIAADGARSFLRRAVGIELRGADDVMTGHTTLFHAPLWEVAGPHRHLIYSTAHGSLIPTGPGDRWLLGHQQSHGAVEQIRAAAGVPDLPVRVVRTRAFSAAAQLAERWRSGPVFLVGDAAHRVTPRGGTGLNLALHDGHDLGWKLAWVLNGWAGPELLDSYEAERRPVADHTVARSADPNGSLRPVEEARVDLGGRIPHVATEQGSTLDLLGPGLTLFAARGETDWRALVYVDAPVTVRLLEPVAARALGVHPGTAMLVRPDGHASEYVSARPVGGRLGTSRADREVIP